MKYVLTAGWDDGIADLTERLVLELAEQKKVLWLVSGGSNIPASVQVIDNIPSGLRSRLTIMSADERYGKPGHPDSNWQQLLNAGFNPGEANILPPLEKGLNFQQAADRYNKLAEQSFADNDIVIAQLGIGVDGEIAGILPESPATTEQEGLIMGYQGPAFKRITLTFAGLLRVNAAYTFAFGNTKYQALHFLRSRSINPVKQPAQILKRLPEAYIYSDQVGVQK